MLDIAMLFQHGNVANQAFEHMQDVHHFKPQSVPPTVMHCAWPAQVLQMLHNTRAAQLTPACVQVTAPMAYTNTALTCCCTAA